MNKIFFNGIEIEYICKKNLKHSYLSISKGAKVILKTPKVSKDFIDELLVKKEKWIKKQLLILKQNQPIKIEIKKEVLLFGKIYPINSNEVMILKNSLSKLKVQSDENILKCYNNFYKDMAKSYLTLRVEYFSKLMNLYYNEIKYKKLKRRWGSCSSLRVITLNIQLLKLDKELIDYVVVHELAHLKHMNHSSKFHYLVRRYLDDEKSRRERLKKVNIILA